MERKPKLEGRNMIMICSQKFQITRRMSNHAENETRRSAAKRFKATATGEFKRGKAFRSHILEHKSPTRKRNLRKAALVHKTDHERVAKMLPYA